MRATAFLRPEWKRMIDDEIRAGWERFHAEITAIEGYVPGTPVWYIQGYRDGYAAAHAPAVIDAMKAQITLLRIELKDALTMAYGARMNWPESAKALLESE
jgi:hypothetical protein